MSLGIALVAPVGLPGRAMTGGADIHMYDMLEHVLNTI
jgi:hypothetical protein